MQTIRTDIAVIGGGLGGVAAALAALEMGRRVVLTESTDWLGGQLTAQLTPLDEHRWIESHGCTASYRRLRNEIRRYYHQWYPLTAEARALPHLNPGNGFVSAICHEPRVGLAVLEAMLRPYVTSGRLQILYGVAPVAAAMGGDAVQEVQLQAADGGGNRVTIEARYFLDATDLGELLPLCGAEYVTGAEARHETGEPHAPLVAAPLNQQAFTVPMALGYDPERDHTIDRPANYEFWRAYVPAIQPPWPGRLFCWTHGHHQTHESVTYEMDPPREAAGDVRGAWLYRRIVDKANYALGYMAEDVSIVNWALNDYLLGPLVGVPAAEAAAHVCAAREQSRALLYWLQTESPRADGGRGWPGLRLRPDISGTPDGLAKAPYIRESRRIRAEFTVLEEHVSKELRPHGACEFEDTVGIGSYHLDLHPSCGGDNYIALEAHPFQIPLGALLPVRLSNLLPACKNIGTTHITNGCYRLHPVEWNVGEVAGALAAHCLQNDLQPREVRSKAAHLAEFQQLLVQRGVELCWPLAGHES